jgi:predicted Zn-dependent protease
MGLILMARACYDPRAAISVWQRMSQAEGSSGLPVFLSTHPASKTRVEMLRQWLPEAEREYERSGCYESLNPFR